MCLPVFTKIDGLELWYVCWTLQSGNFLTVWQAMRQTRHGLHVAWGLLYRGLQSRPDGKWVWHRRCGWFKWF